MSSTQQTTTTLPASQPLTSEPAARVAPWRRVRVKGRVRPHHLALTAVLALSAVLNVNRLTQNEYGNTFYSTAVRSMLDSWHNFFFISFDPSGLITVDKPPLALWVQALSAKLFGFTPLSLLLPEAIMGVLAVAALYWVLTPRFGAAAGVASALALAVFPSFVAISRENGVDSLLILLMILACGACLRACETGRLRPLLLSALLVGLAFNTKTLAAFLVVPGLGLGYLVCAPGSIARRAAQLLAAGAVLLLVSASWSAIMELTPASQRPFVGGSTDNTEHNLTFDYNGLGRVEGQVGGPGRIPILVKHGSLAHIEREALRARAQRAAAARGGSRPGAGSAAAPARPAPVAVVPAIAPKHKPPPAYLPNGRAREPTAFGGATGPLRLLDKELGGQAGWMLPFALLGMIALALWSIGARSGAGAGDGNGRSERDGRSDRDGGSERGGDSGGRRRPTQPSRLTQPLGLGAPPDRSRLAGLIVLGVWFLVEAAVLSLSKGIVHPYYVSALGPGAAAMIGGGTVAFVARGRRRGLRLALIPIAVGLTVWAQLTLLKYDHYLHRFWPVLILGAMVGVAAILITVLAKLRLTWTRAAMGLTLCLLLIAPAAYAATTWDFPVEGTFPAAGPHAAGAVGRLGVDPYALRVTRALIAYVGAHHPGTRWDVLTEASDTAAPAILLGYDAGAMGGYSGNDPALDGASLARLVQRGQARYVVLGGAYAERGGNAATNAVIASCEAVPAATWQPRPVNPNALLLYDCAGHERALRAS
jgi:4-amino-4-deoxy-L-arabinose transferase-like glycosyltransferase